MRSKKAFAIQFSWIFILIVGFFIMIFVVSSISKSKDVSDSDINVEIKENFGSIITSAEQSTETFKIIDTPELIIKSICEEDYSAYSINGNIERIDNLVLYTPEQVEGRKIYTWAKEYKMPMKIANVLYLSDPDHMYIFVDLEDDNKMSGILKDFPENMTMEVLTKYNDLKEYKDKNFDYYTFVMVGSGDIDSNFPTSSKIKRKSTIVVFDFDSFNYESGKVTFYDYDYDMDNWGEGETTDYAGEAMLYGAIFSGNKELYDCNTNKLLQKSETMYKVYNYTTLRQNELTTKAVCILTHYPNAIDIINELSNSIEANDLESLYSNSLNLEILNKRIRKDGCSLIY